MKQQYIITEQELLEKGINLQDYVADNTGTQMIISRALDLSVSQIIKMGDNLQFESDIEEKIDKDNRLVAPFKKLQFNVIYNLLFVGDADPMDKTVCDIIAHELKLGKINGIQKGWR